MSLTAEDHRCRGAHHREERGILWILSGHRLRHKQTREREKELKRFQYDNMSVIFGSLSDVKGLKDAERPGAKSRIPEKS